MAIKKISQFASGTPTSSDKILFEQNGSGKNASIENIVNTCAVSYDTIQNSSNLSNKIASAQSVKDIGGRFVTGTDYFTEESANVGKQVSTVYFPITLPNKPRSIFLTWRDTVLTPTYCEGLQVDPETITTQKFEVTTNRKQLGGNWYFYWLAIY